MPYCSRCKVTRSNLDDHRRDSPHHHICSDCDLDFETYDELQGHWRSSSVHEYCTYCDELFDSVEEFISHKEDEHAYCGSCDRVFWNGGARGLHDHCRQMHAERYCVLCKRMFQSEQNLQGVRC